CYFENPRKGSRDPASCRWERVRLAHGRAPSRASARDGRTASRTGKRPGPPTSPIKESENRARSARRSECAPVGKLQRFSRCATTLEPGLTLASTFRYGFR